MKNKIIMGISYVIKNRRIPSIAQIKRFLGLNKKIIVPLPDFAQIEVTTKCNLNCITCSRQSLSVERLNRDMNLPPDKRKRMCPWSFYQTFITVDDYVTPCCIRMDKDAFYFGNIYEKPFIEIWNGEKMKKFREANLKNLPNPVCDFCPD